MAKKMKNVGTVSSSSDFTKKKIERVGLDGTAGQGFENGSGNPSNSLNYNQKTGEQYHTLVTTGAAKANAVRKPGATNDPNASVDKAHADRLQNNPEKVRDAVPQPAGYTTRLAQNNPNGNPKLRTKNTTGGPTVPGTGEDN